MLHRILFCLVFLSLVAFAQPADLPYDNSGESWSWSDAGEESAGGSSYLGIDIADVTTERLGELKLKEEHGAEVTMVDQDAPAGKAGLKEHDVILSVNGAAVESAAQLRRMIHETPAGRIVTLGISRDGQPLSIKVQLADRRKSFAVSSNDRMFNFKMPSIPPIPPMPDFDVPVSVVIVHSSLRSGLMVENMTPQLGEFFGVKSGNGVLVRSVEKGSRADKSGFRAGDVIVKVNDQPVHDTSDFTHALRAHSGGPAAVTVVREKKEQNLTLTLPEKKDSGSLLEEGFEVRELSADAERQLSRFGEQMARIQPALEKMQQKTLLLKDLQQNLQDFQQEMQEQGEKCRHELTGAWAEI
jgi:membrane-associated protease RseP (regulator of RpoE activity)